MIALLTTHLQILLLDVWHTADTAARFVAAETPPGRGAVCPVAPAGAQPLVDQFLGWFAWFLVWIGFPASILAAIGAILIGKLFSMPHVGKGGLIGIFVVLGAALLYLVVPGILAGFLGDGCVTR
ncbi:hypothetical protein [Tessaracoccus antarcticus]|uniref:Uncharacterized protein n=1 Tax=Tessaracoccus antarcticus TaxID=2479848 RepID=A0A3M0GIX3_9ACTN|nr:hypothetical protein [Tessaracoccus antarcticus]RMB57236.1 hypothetical protein EAX62_15960 [Tessaracoccus antarcticus]